MENPITDKFELEPAIDALAQLLRSSSSMMEQLTVTYFERLRYLNELLFDMTADAPSLSSISSIWTDMSDPEEEAEDVVDSAASNAVPPVPAAKRSRRSGARMH